MTDTERVYIVQVLANMLLTYKQRPSLSDCDSVAKAMIKSYPFLADAEGTTQVLLLLFISSSYIYMYLFHSTHGSGSYIIEHKM